MMFFNMFGMIESNKFQAFPLRRAPLFSFLIASFTVFHNAQGYLKVTADTVARSTGNVTHSDPASKSINRLSSPSPEHS